MFSHVLEEYNFLGISLVADICFYLLIGMLGAAFASFITCTAWRIKEGADHIATKRSHCDHCGHVLNALDLVPIFSWLFLKGRCRYCGTKIPAKTVLSELTFGLIFACAFYICGISMPAIIICLSVCVVYFFAIVFKKKHKPVNELPKNASTHVETINMTPFNKNPRHIEMEKCVLCGRETNTPRSKNIEARKNYVEGVGEVCDKCKIKLNTDIVLQEQ